VIFTTGFGQPVRLFAVNPLGTGDITNTNMVWQTDKDVPGINSPVVKDGLIYMIQERGTITCLEAKTGNVIWKNKLKGEFYSSPIIGDGKIYFPSKQGFVYVLKEGKEFNILAVNKLNGEFWTTMAVSGNSLILRTDKALYCIDKK
jgi:outer membrane protein assembly factor BamB